MSPQERKEQFKAIMRASMLSASLRPDLYDPKETLDRLIKIHPDDEEIILKGWEEVSK